MRVALLGVGLIGGSIGLAARERLEAHVVGWNRSPGPLQTALEIGAIDEAVTSLEQIGEADVAIASVSVDALPAAVRDLGGRLAEHEALFRVPGVDPVAVPVLHDLLVIEVGIEPAQAEVETAPARRGAVTRALVAAVVGEHRHDVVGEIDGPDLAGSLDRHRDSCAEFVIRRGERGRAVGEGFQNVADEGGPADRGQGEGRSPGHVPPAAVGVSGGDDQALPGARVAQRDGRGLDLQREDAGRGGRHRENGRGGDHGKPGEAGGPGGHARKK
jgi:hypothetical protein